MKQKTFLSPFCLPLLIAVFGCNPDSPLAVSFNPPTCTISSIQKADASWPYPAKLSMTVENTGEATAFDVECEIKLKSGNTIVDEGLIYFGTLASHESYTQDERFWNITSHSEYSSAEYHLFWFDSQGDYHD